MSSAFPTRLLAAAIGGCVVALALAFVGAGLANFWKDSNDEDEFLEVPVELLYNYSRADLAELLGDPEFGLPDVDTAPPPPLPPRAQREVRGFVMLEVEVDAEGQPIDARVTGGAPVGVYEREARQQALALTYSKGRPGARQQVIRFSLPADDPLLKKAQ